jgi:DNA repair protein SbcD/Mre11
MHFVGYCGSTDPQKTRTGYLDGGEMKFIHAADIHLDSPLHGLRDYPDAPAAQLRNASREAFRLLVDRALEEDVLFLLIAGDLYDGDWKDHNTGLFFSQQMGRLRKKNIRVFIVCGNHDAESEMTKKLEWPDNVHLFSSRKPEFRTIDEHGVAIHGQSFREKAVFDNLAAGYPAPIPGYYNIGVLHTALEGYSAHASYAPCTRTELNAKGYDYWALGHVHEYQHWSEISTIVYPGNIQGRNIRELGRRGAVLVTVANGRTAVERLFLDVLRWESVIVDASSCRTMADLSREVGLNLEKLLSVDAHVPRALRITLTGKSPAHGLFWGQKQQLRAEVLNQVGILGNEKVWLEKVKVATAPLDSFTGQADFLEALGDLRNILEDAENDPDFIAALASDLAPFMGRVRAEVDGDHSFLALARSGSYADLAKKIGPLLLNHLATGA